MRTTDWLHWIYKAVATNPARSWLTSLGMAIGIASVTLLTSIGEGVQQYILTRFSQFGTHLIAITPGKVTTEGLGNLLNTVKPLTLEDSEQLVRLPHVEQVVPVSSGTSPVEYGKFSRNVNVFGVGHNAAKAWLIKVTVGRFLPEDDPFAPRNYVVLGHTIKREFFRNRNPIGELLRVGGMRFRVIGVMEEKGQMLGFDLDDAVYIPTSKALQIFNRNGLMEIDVVFNPIISSQQMSDNVKKLMHKLHGADDFTIFTQEDMLSSLGKILDIMKLAVGGLGSIALLVGGVGVFTIMTTSMRERTEEIGLLRALGTTHYHILSMFLGEAILLSTLGGAIGLVVVVLLMAVLKLFLPGLPLLLNPAFLLFAISISALIGLVAGIYPAHIAAKLDPIEALRAE